MENLTDDSKRREDWIFYHSLYHLIAHWAALVATVGLLLNVLVMIGTAARPLSITSLVYSQIAILGMLLGSWFFAWRMVTYSKMVKGMIASPKYEETLW